MKAAATTLIALLIAGAMAFYVSIRSKTRHLTETPPQKVQLVNGTNVMRFPVVQGRYLLRIGRPDMEPVAFTFHVLGRIDTPSGPITIDETYAPRPELLSKQVSGGHISRVLEITNHSGHIGVEVVTSFPEAQSLTCTFHGIK
jgi:hypothetical protein